MAGTRTSSLASYNDVFFLRKGGEGAPQQSAEPPVLKETPEISEISEIPEMRDAATAEEIEDRIEAAVLRARSESGVAQSEVLPKAAPGSIAEEMVARLNANAPAQSGHTGAVPLAEKAGTDDPKTELQESGGILKRFFDKFK